MTSSTTPATSTKLNFSRFQNWQETTSQFYSKTDCVQLESASFRASLSRHRFGGVVAGHASSSAISYIRRRIDIQHDNVDDFVIVLMRQGRLRIAQGDVRVEGQPGDLIMYHQASPFEITVIDECDAVLVSVPAPMITSRLGNAKSIGLRSLKACSPEARFSASIFANFGDVDQLEGLSDQARISGAALDMFAATLTNTHEGREPDLSTRNLLDKVQRYMRAQLDNPQLSVAAISMNVGVSERTLNRLFAAQHTTPMRWLWKERLTYAYNALASGHAVNVTDAAFAFGFKDVSHFSRAFRHQFHQPPSALLKQRTSNI